MLDTMRDSPLTLLALAAIVVLLVTAPVAAMAGVGSSAGSTDATHSPTAQTDGSNGSSDLVAPGERVAGVVDVGEAEVEHEVEARALGHAFDRADSNASKAAVLATTVEDIDDRLGALEERRAALQRAHENGSLSDGRYRAEIAGVAARISAVQDLANRTGRAATGLPTDVLEANGVNVTAIETLRSQAGNLTGPEVAAIAEDIAGKNAGRGFGPGDRGPPAARPGSGPPGDGAGGPGDGAGPGDGGQGPRSDGEDRDTDGQPDDGAAGDGDAGDAPTAETPEPPTDPVTYDGNTTTAT
jgi:hypothetical protein